MIQHDYEQFVKMFEVLCVYYSRASNPEQLAVYWTLLKEYSIDQVQAALNAHMSDPETGMFFPLKAHLMKHFNLHDCRITADEAWAEVPKSEAESVVWTPESAAAYWPVLDLLESGDLTAARMAFRAGYDRLVREAREENNPVEWVVCLGDDKHGREKALQNAINKGRITLARAQLLLPHVDFQPPPESNPRLTGNSQKRIEP